MSNFNGTSGNDSLMGTSADDNFDGGAGNDTIDGGAMGSYGNTVQYSGATTGVTVNLTTGMASDGQGGTDVLRNIQHINGTRFADNLTGNDQTNWFRPGAGNDTINGMGGQDVVMYEDATAGVAVDLIAGTASGTSIGNDVLISVEAVHGSYYNDTIKLANTSGYVFARAGNDYIQLGSSGQWVSAGSGNDTIVGGAAYDTLDYGDDGYDSGGTVFATRGVTVNLQTGTATDNWGNTDTISGIERISGSQLADNITGDNNSNQLSGGAGNDTLKGGGGNDNLDGGEGTDRADYSGLKSQYSLIGMGGSNYMITDLRAGSPDGSDILTNIEQLSFSDGVTDLSWATVVPTAGLKVEVQAPFGINYPKGGVEDVSGNMPMVSFQFTSFDAVTGKFTASYQKGIALNPRYAAGSTGSDGQRYVAGAYEFTGTAKAGLPFAVGTIISASNSSLLDNWVANSTNVTLSQAKTSLLGSDDGVQLNGTQFGYALQALNNIDLHFWTGNLPDASKMAGNDTLIGSTGNDTLAGFDGTDLINGGAGNDSLDGGAGNDTINGGDGNDTAVFSGAYANYSFSFNSANQTLTVTDTRSTTTSGYSGVDSITNVENFQFGDQSKSFAQLVVSAAGVNYGVDLNGANDPSTPRVFWLGPNQYWPSNTSTAGTTTYSNNSTAGFWGAEIGLSSGIKALRLSTVQSATSLQSKVLLDWKVGTSTLAFGGSTSSPVTFSAGGKSFNASEGTHVTNGVTYYDLNLSTTDGSLATNDQMQQALTNNVTIAYRAGAAQPAHERLDVQVQVNISADGSNWVGAGAGQTDLFVTRLDNVGPIAAYANYSGRLIGISFKNTGNGPEDLPNALDGDWRGNPDKSLFKVEVDGYAVAITNAVMTKSGINLSLANDISPSAKTVTVSYQQTNSDKITNAIQDWNGNDAANFKLVVNPALPQSFSGTVSANAIWGFDNHSNNESAPYVDQNGGFNDNVAKGTITSVTSNTATLTLLAPTWGLNPGYDASATSGLATYRYSKEKFEAVLSINSGAYKVGDTIALADLISMNNGLSFTTWVSSVVMSSANSASDVGTSFELARFALSSPAPVWAVAVGFFLNATGYSMTGGPGDDSFDGHGSNAVMRGGDGNDTYWVTAIGMPDNTLIDDSSGASDTLVIRNLNGTPMTRNGYRVGDDLVWAQQVRTTGQAAEVVTIKNQYTTGTLENFKFVNDTGATVSSFQFAKGTTGTAASEIMFGTQAADTLNGGGGNDWLIGSDGNDVLNGGDGNDTLRGGTGSNQLFGGNGDDYYAWNVPEGATDSITDTAGTNQLSFNASAFNLDGQRVGNDVILSSVSNGVVTSSVRLVNQLQATAVQTFSWLLVGSTTNYTFSATQAGTDANEWFVGTANGDTINGGGGNDLLFGGAGNDSLIGGAGDDVLLGGTGGDTLVGGTGNDRYLVNDANDVIIEMMNDNTPSQKINSVGNGNDVVVATVSYTLTAMAGIEDMLASGRFLGDATDNAIDLTGNDLAQSIWGNNAGNVLRGAAGDDILFGAGGNDTLYGDDGNDGLFGGTGNDVMYGGEGNDTVFTFWKQAAGYNFFNQAGDMPLSGGNDTAYGGNGTDTLVVNGLQSDFNVVRLGQDDYLITSKTDTTESVRFSQFESISFGVINFANDQLNQTNQTFLTPSSLSITGGGAADTTAPLLVSKSPVANATTVAPNANLSFTFNEAIKAGSGYIVLNKAGVLERTINIADATQVVVSGTTLTINPTLDLSANATYSVDMGAGVVQDTSGNDFAGLGSYSFTTQANAATPSSQFVSISNAKLVKDITNNKSTVTFSIALNGATLESKAITGMLLDLDYDATLVSAGRATGVQYDNAGSPTAVWQFITPNLYGNSATGKIAGIAATDTGNPLLVSGKTMDVTLTLNQAVDTFALGFNKQAAHITTADGVDHLVGTSADMVLTPSSSQSFSATANFWKNTSAGATKALSDVTLSMGGQTLYTDTSGVANFASVANSQTSLAVSKTVASADKATTTNAVNLTDAISILKMIVGLNVNSAGTALSPYQVVAADFNRDGTVGLTDAIDVLKMVVGLTAPSPTWALMDNSKVSNSLSMDSYNSDTSKTQTGGWLNPSLALDLSQTSTIKLVGVLAGDVDGSWAG